MILVFIVGYLLADQNLFVLIIYYKLYIVILYNFLYLFVYKKSGFISNKNLKFKKETVRNYL